MTKEWVVLHRLYCGRQYSLPASRLYCCGTKRMKLVTVTSYKEMDTINELLGVDLVWFDTIQKG